MQNDIVNNPRLFYCYSPMLKKQLTTNGFKYLHKGTHDKTNKTFWVFYGTKELNNFLQKRRENHQKQLIK